MAHTRRFDRHRTCPERRIQPWYAAAVTARLWELLRTAHTAMRATVFQEFMRFGSSSIVVQVSRVASDLIVAALLGPAIWGAWYLLNLIIAYSALTQLGAMNAMNREVPSALGRADPEEAVRIRRTALGVVLVSTSFLSLMLLLSVALVPSSVAVNELILVLALLAAHQLFGYASTTLRATMRFSTLAHLQLTLALVYPILTIGSAWAYGLPGFIVGQLLTYAAVCVLAARSSEVVYRPTFEWSKAKTLVAIGFPIMLVGLVNTLFTTVDRWVVAAYMGTEPLGHYSVAIMALGAVALLPQVIAQQFYPRIVMAWSARGDPSELRRVATTQRRLTFVAVVPVVVVSIVVLPPVVQALLPAFAPGIPALMITMFVPVVSAVGQGYGGILHALNRQTWLLGAIVVAAIANVSLSTLLVGPYGLVGVATGTLASFAILAGSRVVLGTIALRRVGCNPSPRTIE